ADAEAWGPPDKAGGELCGHLPDVLYSCSKVLLLNPTSIQNSVQGKWSVASECLKEDLWPTPLARKLVVREMPLPGSLIIKEASDSNDEKEDEEQKVTIMDIFHGITHCTVFLPSSLGVPGLAMPFGCVTLGDKKDYNQPSEVTDRYDLGQVIKTEEFCEIFRAKEKTTGKLYTCKKFLKRDGRKVRKAAKNEIIILKMVKHPNILQLVDVYVTRKEYFLFLELATGREVFDWILDQGYYSERDTSNVIRQVLEAVAYLHSLKIVHRNLKAS
ncbi:CaM kinase-like vesicle-associated protein, partial [Varanus komodoensis]